MTRRCRGRSRRAVLRSVVLLLALALAVAAAGCSRPAEPADSASLPGPSTPSTRSTPSAPSPSSTLSAPSAPTGTSQHTVSSGGMDRTYRLYRPAGIAKPAPLVVVLHGSLGSGRQAERDYGWDAKARTAHAVVAYPDGYRRTWNAGNGCCGPAVEKNVDDVAFLERVVSDVSSRVPVDRSRVYVAGISNGSVMAYRMACDTRTFAAIGIDSASVLGSCEGTHPTSVLHIHGLADQTIPYAGGVGPKLENRTRQGKRAGTGTRTGTGTRRARGAPSSPPAGMDTDWPPVPDVLARWRAIDRCATPAESTRGPVSRSTAQCPGGRTVEGITIAGAGHQWPGSRPNNALERRLGLDPPSHALNATDEFWSFFAAHPA